MGRYLEELVHAVSANPVRVEHAEVAAAAADTLLGNVAQGAAKGHVVDGASALGLAANNALVNGPFAVATADANTVDNVPLLGLVSETAPRTGTHQMVAHVGSKAHATVGKEKRQTKTTALRLLCMRNRKKYGSATKRHNDNDFTERLGVKWYMGESE